MKAGRTPKGSMATKSGRKRLKRSVRFISELFYFNPGCSVTQRSRLGIQFEFIVGVDWRFKDHQAVRLEFLPPECHPRLRSGDGLDESDLGHEQNGISPPVPYSVQYFNSA